MLIDDAHQIGQQTLPFVRREFPKSTVRAEFSHVDGLVSSIFRLDFFSTPHQARKSLWGAATSPRRRRFGELLSVPLSSA
jgi:hypothetical protein